MCVVETQVALIAAFSSSLFLEQMPLIFLLIINHMGFYGANQAQSYHDQQTMWYFCHRGQVVSPAGKGNLHFVGAKSHSTRKTDYV